MKVSVSLPDDDLAFVERYARDRGKTRSAVLHEAVQLLRQRDLAAEYESANDEWVSSGEADVWDAVTGDLLR
ncbi:ribbon-helix-helix protein, CopG family [Solwaraspora sp. WMMA2056]|uniref:ribbon-helix-helix protein, CopG family n=1 Tax=Solwaraspora sp. WMMA2056 TaxID=3015161 RepID=UPI00259BC87E|nr:ribbon-helix-helix protein, CopG family [Solwaraspora sp. WMMA2056]WJK41969.1 ribbon-helix-helix protein, CopG family [Solwaraspora sp. WMMA2056]